MSVSEITKIRDLLESINEDESIPSKLEVISTTYQGYFGDWVYRFIDDSNGVLVRRTRKDSPSWTHGVLTQMIEKTSRKFMPTTSIGTKDFLRFTHVEKAVKFVENYTEDNQKSE